MENVKGFADIAEANAALKAVKNHADFKQYEARLAATDTDSQGRHCAPALYGRRRGYHAFSFSTLKSRWGTMIVESPERAHYLFDDGASVGSSRWENLYRVLVAR